MSRCCHSSVPWKESHYTVCTWKKTGAKGTVEQQQNHSPGNSCSYRAYGVEVDWGLWRMKKLLFTIKAYQNRLPYFVFYWFITTLNVYFALLFGFSSLFDFINTLRMPAMKSTSCQLNSSSWMKHKKTKSLLLTNTWNIWHFWHPWFIVARVLTVEQETDNHRVNWLWMMLKECF